MRQTSYYPVTPKMLANMVANCKKILNEQEPISVQESIDYVAPHLRKAHWFGWVKPLLGPDEQATEKQAQEYIEQHEYGWWPRSPKLVRRIYENARQRADSISDPITKNVLATGSDIMLCQSDYDFLTSPVSARW